MIYGLFMHISDWPEGFLSIRGQKISDVSVVHLFGEATRV
jgi:hypothetical protein